MEAKAICSKVLACFELGVLFNTKVVCLMASVACYSLGCYKPTVVCLRPRWLVGAQDGLSATVVLCFKPKVACFRPAMAGFKPEVACFKPERACITLKVARMVCLISWWRV